MSQAKCESDKQAKPEEEKNAKGSKAKKGKNKGEDNLEYFRHSKKI